MRCWGAQSSNAFFGERDGIRIGAKATKHAIWDRGFTRKLSSFVYLDRSVPPKSPREFSGSLDPCDGLATSTTIEHVMFCHITAGLLCHNTAGQPLVSTRLCGVLLGS